MSITKGECVVHWYSVWKSTGGVGVVTAYWYDSTIVSVCRHGYGIDGRCWYGTIHTGRLAITAVSTLLCHLLQLRAHRAEWSIRGGRERNIRGREGEH